MNCLNVLTIELVVISIKVYPNIKWYPSEVRLSSK